MHRGKGVADGSASRAQPTSKLGGGHQALAAVLVGAQPLRRRVHRQALVASGSADKGAAAGGQSEAATLLAPYCLHSKTAIASQEGRCLQALHVHYHNCDIHSGPAHLQVLFPAPGSPLRQ